MIRIHSRKSKRSAFTMIELMVVILIIGLLVSLVTVAAVKVMGKIPEVQTRTDIGEMDQALASFMADYSLSTPPPSSLLLAENGSLYAGLIANPATSALATKTTQFLQKWFGRSFNIAGNYDWNGNRMIDQQPYILQGQQCLVFYLGGIPTYSTLAPVPVVSGMTGFSANVIGGTTTNFYGPATPAAAGANRKGPYFQFNPARLVSFNTAPTTSPHGYFPVYIDAWRTKAGPFYTTLGGTPYAFFSSQGKINGYSSADCALINAHPYYEVVVGGANYTNNNRYQILSAGQNGIFGINAANPADLFGVPWVPASGATGTGSDDQANFSSGLLGTGQR